MKRALVIGCSANVWEDVKQAHRIGSYHRYYCVKLAGVHWQGGWFVWCTLHPEFMDDYERQRMALGYGSQYEIVAPLSSEVGMHGAKGNISRRVSYRYPGMDSSASSGGYAAKVALDDGFDRVVLAGVPMDGSNHFSRGKPWQSRDSFTKGFQKSVPHFAGKVKSMSGWTQEILGAPTPEWLAEV